MGKMNLSETEHEELMSMQRSRTMAVGQVEACAVDLAARRRGLACGDHGGIALRFALHYNVAKAFHQ
ncbi:MAG: hypothetical protein PPHEINF_6203 [uncultured Paraburkholderia sp.]|nr:MAG: hypothetical protein PPHEINF_6203 [uncultured Paraburkholderia sp.]CAH2809441.1 MAG: hypothetical protein PPHEESC_6148 [uncultured Paraburkholderia sp.]CAH2945127.1 MAG: hypothetical protein PPHERAN_6204 [uncultured Paraburkholderia sp.]CAH2945280.1 MAG: hypothetical protein PPHEMADMSA_6236 [uncultured Paraburkholderia sp.]